LVLLLKHGKLGLIPLTSNTMKWEVKTKKATHHIETVSSRDAVDRVQLTDTSEIVSVKLLPKTLTGKFKRFFKNLKTQDK
jgi:hypothetical protein